MFRHKGQTRTHQHNIRIASLLSFVAGIVNVAGVLAVQRLTTNVTGHFAFFIDEVYKLHYLQAFLFFLYIFFFFAGSFVSGFLVELLHRRNPNYEYVVPAMTEALLIFSAAVYGNTLTVQHPDILACILLFAMGLQNSMVTAISNSAVRTTHLTGLFTDLGIELSQLFFYRQHEQRSKLFSSIKLRLTIIIFFFTGGVTGGVFYSYLGIRVLFIAGIALLAGILFDYLKLRLIRIRRRFNDTGS